MMEWMIDTLLATSALIMLVLIIRRPVASYFGPIIAYSLWIIPAARLFMPSLTKTQHNIVSDTNSVMQNTANHIGNSANYSSVNIALDNANEITAISNVGAPSFDYMLPILMIWSSVAVIIFIFQMGRYLSLRDELLDNADEIGTQEGVTLIQSDIVSGPFAFGIFKKYIAVPMDFNKIFEPEMREMAIAHEMTHHRYFDLMINLAAFIFLCLTWFSPLSWYAWTKFRTDQESACDARVLKGADQETKHIYGKAIARGACKEASTFLAAMSSPKTILTRLRRLKMPPISKSRSFLGRLSILTVTAIALPLTATTIPIAAQDIDSDHNSSSTVILTSQTDNADNIKTIKIKSDRLNSKKTKIIKINDEDNDIQTIEKEGKVFHISSDGELSQEKIEKIIEDAEKSIEDIDFSAIEDSVTKSFVIKSDTDGEIKTFDIIGDEKADGYSKSVIFKNKNGEVFNIKKGKVIDIDGIEKLKTDLDIKFDDQILKCAVEGDSNGKNCENIDIIIKKEIAKFQQQDLIALKNEIRNNLIPAIEDSLKNTELPKKERKEIIKGLKTTKEIGHKTCNASKKLV